MALAGIETMHPDVYVIEERGLPRIIGVGVNTGGFVGVAEKGPLDRADLVTNITQFYEKYGGFYRGSFLEPSVRAFFEQGGTRCFVSRVIGLGALAATSVLANHEASPSIGVDAISAGAWGNEISITTEKYRTAIAPSILLVPPVGNGSTQIPVYSLRNVRRGDLLVITDPASGNVARVFVYNVAVVMRLVICRPIAGLPPGFTFPVGSLVQSASDHRISTYLAEDLVNGATQVRLASTMNLTIGARVYFDDGVNFTSVVVERIDGSIIRFAPVAIPATLPALTTLAVSQEWSLKIFERGRFKELHEGLSMQSTNERDYFALRLAGEGNESVLISVVDLFPPVVDETMAIPMPVVRAPLTGGTEGAPLTDADYIGSDVPPKSGMFLLEDVPELNFFSIPGITLTSVNIEAAGMADREGRLVAVLDPPLALDDPIEILNYRNITLNLDTSYAVLYYPWIITRDPQIGNARIAYPPSGYVQGKYAETGLTRGVHYAPANVTLRNVLDLTYHVTDGEQDILNPAGINCIRSFVGEGIRIWGARTLTSFHDGRHYVNVRRLLNFIKDSLRRGLRWAVFELNDPRTWETITNVSDEFLEGLWLRGMLFPSNDKTRAYFVKCDEETNPMSEIREGRLNCEIGVNPPLPAEFVIVRLGMWDGGTTIEEELARRG